MKPVIVPTTDVNSETGILVQWRAENRSAVRRGQIVAEIETSKAVVEVEAPEDGWLLQAADQGAEVRLQEPIAHIFPDETALAAFAAQAAPRPPQTDNRPPGLRITDKARRLAEQHGLDLAALDRGRLITQKDIEALIAKLRVQTPADLPPPLKAKPGMERVVLVGAGMGAEQALDIMGGEPQRQAVAIIDDNPELWGRTILGVPVIGGADRLAVLHREDAFDSVLIVIGGSVEARAKFRRLCQQRGIPLTGNVIDPTAKLPRDFQIGRGNMICGFCYFGTGTRVGDNNVISAHNSFDHHNVLGCDIATGPGCMTSGRVRIGDRVRMGTGIFIEPDVVIGDDVVIASGAVVVRSIPSGHAVKTKAGSSVVVPRRPGVERTGGQS